MASVQLIKYGCNTIKLQLLVVVLFSFALHSALPITANVTPRMNAGKRPPKDLDVNFKRDFEVSNANNTSFSYLSNSKLISILVARDRLRTDALYTKIYGKSGHYSSRRKDLDAVSLPVNFGGQTSYAYITRIQLGTPPREFLGTADTGSDLIGIPCDPCSDCFSDPVFETNTSTTFGSVTCSNNEFCSALNSSAGASCTVSGGCGYNYPYAKGFISGELSSDTLTVTSEQGQIETFPGVVFGCAHQTAGAAYPFWGLGRGKLSLVSQVAPMVGTAFSFCFPTYFNNNTTQLVLGSNGTAELIYTPLLPNPTNLPTFYYVNWTGISVDGKELNISADAFRIDQNGQGGLVLDTGTSFTILRAEVYQSLQSEVASRITEYSTVNLAQSGFNLCYDVTELPNGTDIDALPLPTISFHLEGLDVILSHRNTYFMDTFGGNGVALCLAMQPAGLSTLGLPSIFGNYQMQNFYYFFDPTNNRVGLKRTACSLGV